MSNVRGQTIRDFYSNASRYGFARDFQFRITTFDVNGVSLEEDNLIFLKTANLPSKTISTTAAPFMGLDFQIPGTVKFESNNAWNVTFYCTQNYMLRNFLEDSMSNTFDERTSTGDMEPKDLNQNKIVLALFDDQLNIIKTYTLLGAFITKIDDIAYDLTKSGGIVEVKATIAYQYWETGPDTGVSFGLKLGNGIGGAIGQIGSNIANKLVNKTINKLLGGR
jgi:hypothetical protein